MLSSSSLTVREMSTAPTRDSSRSLRLVHRDSRYGPVLLQRMSRTSVVPSTRRCGS